MVYEEQIFTEQSNFNGRLLTVTVMPWSHHVLGYEIPSDREDWHEENLYEGHYGYEIEMLEETRKESSFALSHPNKSIVIVLYFLLKTFSFFYITYLCE